MKKVSESRRSFLKKGGMLAAAAPAAASGILLGTPATASAAPMLMTSKVAPLPKAKGPRVVVVGAGTSGLSVARGLKRDNPKFDVVIVDPRAQYQSCFCSNLWYGDVVNMEYLANHGYCDAGAAIDYIFFQAACTGVDFDSNICYTNRGEIKYDFIYMAPGIDYDYTRMGVNDPETEYYIRMNYPGGWVMPTEQVSVRNKIQGFTGGVFVVTSPSGNYRCLPSPYERACVVAGWIKKNKIPGKVLLLDMNPDITIKAKGFHEAYNQLYPDIVEYVSSAGIKGIDPWKKEIKTEFKTYKFDEMTLYPGVRGGYLFEQLGMVYPESQQKEANIDAHTYNLKKGDKKIHNAFAGGDSRWMPFSKSGNTSQTEGFHIAKLITAAEAGKTIPYKSPHTVCYSMVNYDPLQAIYVSLHYAYDKKKGMWQFARVQEDDNRDAAKAARYLEWGKDMYRNMFT
jgi:Uncharacterized NAD(FAD)-dependent dehydrogenases